MAALKLVESDNVVNFPTPSTFDQAWDARKGQMRTRGDGREKTRKLWEKASGKVGSARLLEALRRYLREEKEPTCGYPGLSVWLNGERFDHWLTDHSDAASQSPRNTFAEPQRGLVVAACGESFVLSYLDPCTFESDGFIIPRTEYARKKLLEVKHVLKEAGIAGLRRKE